MKAYNDNRYAITRLNRTIVLLGGKPVYIVGPEGGTKAVVNEVLTGEVLTVRIKDLDIHPPKLGYCNLQNGHTIYIARSPRRNEWRQGIRSSALVDGNSLNQVMLDNVDIAKTIIGDFPSFQKVLFMMNTRDKYAFDRDFALIKKLGGIFVEYKGVELVAKLVDDTPQILKGKQWVSEALSEVLVGEIKNEHSEAIAS